MDISTSTHSRLLDEIQVALFELAAARDFANDGGDSFRVSFRAEDALEKIHRALEELRANARSLLWELGEAEGERKGPLNAIRERASSMATLVEGRGTLDFLLDELDRFTDITGRRGEWLRESGRADLMEVRMHLHEVYQNYERIVGRPLND